MAQTLDPAANATLSNGTGSSVYPGVTQADAKLLSSLFVNVGLFIVCMAFFLLVKKRVKGIFESRAGDAGSPDGGLWGWAVSAFRFDKEWILRNRGLDAVIYLMVLEYLTYALLPCTVLGLVVLMPVYRYCGIGLPGLDSVSLLNCVPGSPLLWVPFSLCIVYSLWIVTVLYVLYREVTRQRIFFRSLKRPQNYFAMVREMPRDLSAKQLSIHFDTVLGVRGECVSFQVCLRSKQLPKLFAKRTTAVRMLEKVLDNETFDTLFPKMPYFKLGWFRCCKGKRVSAVEYWQKELARLDGEIAEKQKKKRAGAGVAFVSFRHIRTAQMFWQSELHSGNFNSNRFVPSPWIVEAPAPPESINFQNLHISANNRFWRVVLVDVVTVALIVGLYVPLVFFIALANLSSLSQVPIVGNILVLVPASEGFIRGFLPSLGLAIVNLIYVALLQPLVKLIGFVDYASVHRSILGRFFIFIVFNNVLGVTIGGSVLTVFQRLIAGDFVASIELIAVSVPLQSLFFQTYVLLLAIAGTAYYLSRPLDVIMRCFSLKCCYQSRRTRREWDGPFYFTFESAIWPLVVFLFGLVYSIISPIILVFCVVYFVGTYIRGRYDAIYVETCLHPSNGFIFPFFYTVTTWTTVLFQLVTIIILSLYKLYWAPLLGLITALTIAVYILVQLRFSQIAKFGSLSQAPEVPGVLVPPDSYAQPYMLPPKLRVMQKGEDQKETEPAGTDDDDKLVDWERFDAADEETEVIFREKKEAGAKIDPDADTTHVVEPRLRELVSRVMARRRAGITVEKEEDRFEEQPTSKAPRSPRKGHSRVASQVPDAVFVRPSPRNSSPYHSEESPAPTRNRSVTSFMVMSPQSARSYPHLPLPRARKDKEEGSDAEMEEMEPQHVVMATLPRDDPPAPVSPHAPYLFTARAGEEFTGDDVERFIDQIL